MYQSEYFSIPQTPETPSSLASLHSSRDSTTSLPLSSSEHHNPNVYVQNPIFIYFQVLSFFSLILILPSIFLGLMSLDGLVAPPIIADFTSSSPRLTSQIATIISSSLTASVKWALAGVVTIHAQKYFQHSRPIYNIEVFSALRNGGVAWSWNKRPMLMFCTWVVIALCGLLTSGFVALISPFPIAITKDLTAWSHEELTEMDIFSGNPSCTQWHNETMRTLYPIINQIEACFVAVRYPDSDLVYTTCPLQGQYMQALNAATSSIISRFVSGLSTARNPNIVTSFPQLSNTRIFGSTAGTLPTGPAGVHVFSDSIIPSLHSPYNYTLDLQGIPTAASCSYVNNNRSRLVQSYTTDGAPGYNVQCSSDDDYQRQLSNSTGAVWGNGVVLAGLCHKKNSDNFYFHLRSFWGNGDASYNNPSITPAQNNTYAGIHAMECTLTPRISRVVATYRTSLTAFKMTPTGPGTPSSGMDVLARQVVIRAMWQTLMAVDLGQTLWNGNLFGAVIAASAVSYGNLTGVETNPIVPGLVADALKGIFEYQVTHQRLVLTAFQPSNPNRSCFAAVSGSTTEEFIGWDIKWTTAVGLIPLLSIALTCIGVTLWTMLRKERLTVFDPTNPISLLAAASDGKLQFSDEKEVHSVGDPKDEMVKSTKVRYGRHDRRWGLKAE